MKETDRDKNKREISIKKIQSLDGNDSKMLHLSSLPFAYENIYIYILLLLCQRSKFRIKVNRILRFL